jgi:hypothetical protein
MLDSRFKVWYIPSEENVGGLEKVVRLLSIHGEIKTVELKSVKKYILDYADQKLREKRGEGKKMGKARYWRPRGTLPQNCFDDEEHIEK